MLLRLIINALTISAAIFKTSFSAQFFLLHRLRPFVFMGEVGMCCFVNECLLLLCFYASWRRCVKMGFNILEKAFGGRFGQ